MHWFFSPKATEAENEEAIFSNDFRKFMLGKEKWKQAAIPRSELFCIMFSQFLLQNSFPECPYIDKSNKTWIELERRTGANAMPNCLAIRNKFVRHAESTAGNTFCLFVRSVLFGAAARLFDIVFRSRVDVTIVDAIVFNLLAIVFRCCSPACVKHTSKIVVAAQKFGSRVGFCVWTQPIGSLFICSLRFFHSCEFYIVKVRDMWFGSQIKNVFQYYFFRAIERTIADWVLCDAHTSVRTSENILFERWRFFFGFHDAREKPLPMHTVRFTIWATPHVWFSNQNERAGQRHGV